MALTSPGVQVSIIDESQYLPASTNSVPLILLATAQNKVNASGTGVAAGTTAANANKLFQITSQRDLISLYGNPFFYKTTDGTPIQGYELNEYGLLAAYSVLGATNRCFVLRADVDLASLIGQVGRPEGDPVNGTYWLDTTTSSWGVYEFSSVTGKFTNKTPIVITETVYLSGETPLDSVGNIGDYAINAIYKANITPQTSGEYFYKNSNNSWVKLGSVDWINSIPTATSTVSNPTLVAGDQFQLAVNGPLTAPITFVVPVAPNNNVTGISNLINNMALGDLRSTVTNGRLVVYSSQFASDNKTKPISITFTSSNTVLADLGLSNGVPYYQPLVSYGSASQMPLWTTGQTTPAPTGSVWIKTGYSGGGAVLAMSKFNTTAGSFISKEVPLFPSPLQAIYELDSAGGKNIPAGTVYGRYSFNTQYSNPAYITEVLSSPIYIYERIATGPTVVTGSVTSPTFTAGDTLLIEISLPNNNSFDDVGYTIEMPSGTPTAIDFVTVWTAANIPNTTATITTSGAIQITHTLGGEILLTNGARAGIAFASTVIQDSGFIAGTTAGVENSSVILFQNQAAQQFTTTGGGSGASFNIVAIGINYKLADVTVGGIGYAPNDRILIQGTELGGTTPANDLTLKVITVDGGGAVTSCAYVSGNPNLGYSTGLSNWRKITYIANEGAPFNNPAENTNWFYSVTDQVDIMVNQAGVWKGYSLVNYDSNGHPISGSNTTDPKGPIISASAPTEQSDGTQLVYGDLWINTSDLENYPVINRWQSVGGVNQWVLIDNTDQVSQSGVLFADARWATNGTTDPVSDPIPTIASLLTSNYLDLDAPAGNLHPQGMLLFNTRRSGYNVKQFRGNYFNGTDFADQSLPTIKNAWVTTSGLMTNGAPYMGRKAQRAMVVKAIRASISTNMALREEDTFFNLMATPNYPELQPQMIGLNNERNNTAYIIGDTPLRLPDQATAITEWATNAAGASSSGEQGLVSRDEYMGLFYPAGLTTDLTGAEVVVPASHMMLRTFLRNDTVAYPWLAAAGTRRGTIDNALTIGYIDSLTGEYQSIKNRVGIRDVLYLNQINPLAFFTSVGLLNYGNKNSKDTQSAMDRTNVARLVAYIRERLQVVARPFVFEPNDALTRTQITGVVQTLFVDLVAKRGLYDYLVVCDGSNNTPARIDRNELWIDVAIEPVKAAEFIYIPVRILNTGEIAGLK